MSRDFGGFPAISGWHAIRFGCHTVPRILNVNVNWIRVRRLFGETMREIGILVFVFAPLETALTDQPVRRDAVVLAMLGSLTMIVAGVVLEAKE